VSSSPTTLYQDILAEHWSSLPQAVQFMHSHNTSFSANGIATVTAGRNPIAKLIAYLLKFPNKNTQTPVTVDFQINNGKEVWHRSFGQHKFHSTQYAGKARDYGYLIEQFGWLRFTLELISENQKLHLHVKRWTLAHIPMPKMLAPKSEAFEYEHDGKFHFDVRLSQPLIGLLVHYKGWLVSTDHTNIY